MLTAVRPFGGGWRFMSVEDLELFGHGLGSSGNRRTGRIRSAGDLDAAIRVLAESAETVGDDRPLE
ncbi:Uncharacterised protein [Mycobacteroides abscessus subsp. abscessus]|nr:Uncharacterised protein [Mycobacteroides abscessus subsp. abscessus]